MSRAKRKSHNKKGQPWTKAIFNRKVANIKSELLDYVADMMKKPVIVDPPPPLVVENEEIKLEAECSAITSS